MPKKLEFRPITKEERTELEQLKRSRKAEARLVERAKMILWVHAGQNPVDVAAKLDRTAATVYSRLKRFDCEGMAGLEDKPKSGRKPIYTGNRTRTGNRPSTNRSTEIWVTVRTLDTRSIGGLPART